MKTAGQWPLSIYFSYIIDSRNFLCAAPSVCVDHRKGIQESKKMT